MAEKLVIVESPAKSKTINKFLGKDYKVTSSMGHIVDLPKGSMGVDVKNNFKPEYVVIPDRKKYLTKLKKEAKGIKELYLAPDPDREGEAISWHLSNLLGKGRKVFRVTFDEITKERVLKAFENPRESIDMNLVNAQQARRILDRLVGYSLSPLLWKKVSRGLSAGRVQSVAVRLVVEREKEILAFVPKEYWDIEAELKKANDTNQFLAKLSKIDDKKAELSSVGDSEKIVEGLKKADFIVANVKEGKKKRRPTAPFTTSKLQQEAFNRLRFPVNRTMRIAQQLYEGMDLGGEETVGLITYMRTDSVRISDEAATAAKKYIIDKFGKKYYPSTPNIYKSKKRAQEAHEAIRPAVPLREPQSVKDFLKPEQYKLYELIWNRFIASQMVSSQLMVVTIEIKAGRCLFRASGTSVIFDGFSIIYAEASLDKEEDKSKQKLPHVKIGENLDLIKLIPSQHFTKAPPRYSDASLVKALEEEGIGRPSTYAPIIYTIIMRNYIRREKGYLSPTELAVVVNDILIEHFPEVLDSKFTALMEDELDEVEDGKIKWVKVLEDFYKPFSKSLDAAHIAMKSVKKIVFKTDEVCELCGAPMVIKWGRRGKFMSCSTFPKCKHARSITTNVNCQKEGCDGKLVERRSKKRGMRFYGCSKFPKCDFTTNKLPETE